MDTAYTSLNELRDIPDLNYNGYLWFDNEATAKVINGKFDFTAISQLPFIIEGNLRAMDESISVSIRFVDGQYIIGVVDWQEVSNNNIQVVDHRYIGHGFGNSTIIVFSEASIEKNDPFCEGMKTLTPAWIAFCGFKQQEDDK